MRNLTAALFASLLFVAVGCGGTKTNPDMAAPQHDFSVALDGTATTMTGCAKTLVCVAGCASTACQTACLASATTTALQEFNALDECSLSLCLASDAGSFDGGFGSCSSATDPSAACAACLNSAGQSTTCSSVLNACETDTQ